MSRVQCVGASRCATRAPFAALTRKKRTVGATNGVKTECARARAAPGTTRSVRALRAAVLPHTARLTGW
jgi:hypothetical protein